MENETNRVLPSRKSIWISWLLGILPTLLLVTSASFKFIKPDRMEENLRPLGWRIDQMNGLGILELSVAVIYLIPQTSILGAILVTGYIGGAIATHVRIGDYFLVPHILIGVLVWLGVWLRDPRLRELLPIRR